MELNECQGLRCPYQLRENRCGFEHVNGEFPPILEVKRCPAARLGKSRGMGDVIAVPAGAIAEVGRCR